MLRGIVWQSANRCLMLGVSGSIHELTMDNMGSEGVSRFSSTQSRVPEQEMAVWVDLGARHSPVHRQLKPSVDWLFRSLCGESESLGQGGN
jgi:hypothetical protein